MKDVTKKTAEQISKRLHIAEAAFIREIDAIAESARAQILPYFQRNNYEYVTGNGTWLITGLSGDHVLDSEVPPDIRAILYLEVGLHNYLGFHIRDIRRGEW